MYSHLLKSAILLCLLGASSAALAESYNSRDANEIRRQLQQAGLDDRQAVLLLRRMEARKIPVSTAIRWSTDVHDLRRRELPIQVAVDRLQQGLIKNIKVDYLDRAMKALTNNLAWSQDLVIKKTLPEPEAVKDLDEDEQAILNSATVNLEVASRQGYKRTELSVALSRKGVDLAMADEIAKTITVWTNYGVDNKRVLLSIKRGTRVGLDSDKLKDLREKVDSKVVAERLSRPAEIAKVIWHEIRYEAGVMDAEHAYRSRMQRNPNSIKSTSDEGTDVDELNISDVEAIDTTSGGDSGGAGGGEMDSGAGAGDIDVGGGGDIDAGGGEMDGGGESESHESESDMEGGGMGGDDMEGGGMDDH